MAVKLGTAWPLAFSLPPSLEIVLLAVRGFIKVHQNIFPLTAVFLILSSDILDSAPFLGRNPCSTCGLGFGAFRAEVLVPYCYSEKLPLLHAVQSEFQVAAGKENSFFCPGNCNRT